MNYYNLSLSDLLLVDGFKEAYGKKDKETIKRILFENGMDVTQEYEEHVCPHRNLRGQHVHCSRFEGMSRLDPWWIKESGCATLEQWIASAKDETIREDMRGMAKEQNRSGERMYNSRNYNRE